MSYHLNIVPLATTRLITIEPSPDDFQPTQEPVCPVHTYLASILDSKYIIFYCIKL